MKDFILKVPKWEGEIRFTYETVSFLLLWVILAAAVLLCFWGYRYLRSLCLLLAGGLCGVAGVYVAQGMTKDMVWQMCFCVLFTFLGVCLLYGFSMIVTKTFPRRVRGDGAYQRTCLISWVLGSSVAGIVLYTRIYHNIWIAAGVVLALLVCGFWYSKRRAAVRKPFRTYEDIYRMKPLTEEKENA